MLPLLPLAIFALPFILLFLEGKRPKQFAKALSLGPMRPAALFADSIKLFAKAFIVLYAVLFALSLLGIEDTGKVADIVREQETLTLLMAVSLGPVAEELFFRGYLQKRIGVVFASAVFAFLHKGYGSIGEIAGAFAVSIILGHYVREKDSVLPPILAHAFYNAVSLAVATQI